MEATNLIRGISPRSHALHGNALPRRSASPEEKQGVTSAGLRGRRASGAFGSHAEHGNQVDSEERRRAAAHPISRWYLRPLAAQLAALLAPTRVRPVWLTVCGLTAAAAAAAVLVWRPDWMLLAAVLVLVYWFFDRADGLLARRQGTVSAFGAWLDANVDELVDVGLHVAVAAVAASQVAAQWPWFLLIAFLGGKYLLMYGLTVEESQAQIAEKTKGPTLHAGGRGLKLHSTCETRSTDTEPPHAVRGLLRSDPQTTLLQKLYHLPGNADVRIHLLVAALATGWLTPELAIVAIYYNVRWMARYGLVARRLGGSP